MPSSLLSQIPHVGGGGGGASGAELVRPRPVAGVGPTVAEPLEDHRSRPGVVLQLVAGVGEHRRERVDEVVVEQVGDGVHGLWLTRYHRRRS